VMRWDGASVQPFGLAGVANGMRIAANGDLLAAGVFHGPGIAGDVARWNGSSWWTSATGATGIGGGKTILELANGDLVVGGGSNGLADGDAKAVRRWNGSTWSTIGGVPPPVEVRAMVRAANGDVVVAGTFGSLGGVALNHVGRWNGTTWQPFGLGLDAPATRLAAANDGSIVVSGSFQLAGGGPANRIARWHQGAWSTLGSGLPAAPADLAVGPTGVVFAIVPTMTTSASAIHAWDGTAWQVLPQPSGAPVRIACLHDGRLVAWCFGLDPLLAFDGVAWSSLQHPGPIAMDLEVFPDGGLWTVGTGPVMRWLGAGAGWQVVGPGQLLNAYHIAAMPDGSPIVTSYTSGVGGTARRWDGATWQPVGFAGAAGNVALVQATAAGELFVAGTFEQFEGEVAFRIAHGVPRCPAQSAPFGTGCVGAAGPLALTSTARPWVGTVMASTLSGIASNALAVHVVGFAPLATALPLGAPGCSLFAVPAWLDVLAPSSGVAAASLVIPAVASLAGTVVRTQGVALEFAPGAALSRTVSSNALELTIGAFGP
jgi:hypothetical protein